MPDLPRLLAVELPVQEIVRILADAQIDTSDALTDLPADAKYVRAYFDPAREILSLVYAHESFPATPVSAELRSVCLLLAPMQREEVPDA